MMCTPFLVYTYAIHSYIALHVALLYDCLFPLLFSIFLFGCIQTVYTTMCTASHWNIVFHWDITHWHMLLGYSTFQQVYTRYILHIAGIPTYLSLD